MKALGLMLASWVGDLFDRLAASACRRWGHCRDWPEIETCSRCGTPMPLDAHTTEPV